MKTRYVLCTVLFFFVSFLSGCKEQSLLTGLNQRQATEVQAVLQKHQINSIQTALGKGLFDINVKKEDMAVAIQILEQYQLPSNARIEVTQIFPADALVSSPQAEKSRLISAIEQRLEQSLLSISNIIDARVHVSYPIALSERVIQTPHASAIVFYEENTLDSDQLAEDIRAFIRNAFSDMDEDNITILLYPRNINQLVLKKPQLPTQQDNILSFNYWLLLLIFLVIITVAVSIILFVRYSKNKKIMEKDNDTPAV